MTNKIPTSMMIAASDLNYHGDSYARVGVYDAASCTVLGTSDGKVEHGKLVFGGLTFSVQKSTSPAWLLLVAEIEEPCDVCGGDAEGNTCCNA